MYRNDLQNFRIPPPMCQNNPLWTIISHPGSTASYRWCLDCSILGWKSHSLCRTMLTMSIQALIISTTEKLACRAWLATHGARGWVYAATIGCSMECDLGCVMYVTVPSDCTCSVSAWRVRGGYDGAGNVWEWAVIAVTVTSERWWRHVCVVMT